MLVPEAARQEEALGHRLPNYEYGHRPWPRSRSCSSRPSPMWSSWPSRLRPWARVDAGSVAGPADAKPDAIFNVLFGRPGALCARGQHARPVPGPRGGEPAHRRARVPGPAQERSPTGWTVTGYPLVWHHHARAPGVFEGLPLAKYKDHRAWVPWWANGDPVAGGWCAQGGGADTEKAHHRLQGWS